MFRCAGFTLIELLVVCVILAALAYAGVGAYAGVDRRAGDELARVALMRLASALGRFHDDTGYWPGEGPFCAVSATSCAAPSGGAIDTGHQEEWLASPANFWLLFEPPSLPAGHPLEFLENWNPVAHRGWNGPYLPQADRHWVDVWPGLNAGGAPGGAVIKDVPAFAAGPAFSPVASWLVARRQPGGDAAHAFARHARPFIFLLTPSPRVVYWGPDGRYGGTNLADACLPAASSDDVVICL